MKKTILICLVCLMAATLALAMQTTNKAEAARDRQVKNLQLRQRLSESDQVELGWRAVKNAENYIIWQGDKNGQKIRTYQTTKLKKQVRQTSTQVRKYKVRAVVDGEKQRWSAMLTVSKEQIDNDETSELYDEYKELAGTWTGGWNNITYATLGDTSLTADISEDGTADFTIDLEGSVFGLLNPDQQSYTSTYDAEGIIFTEPNDPLFGQMTITITKTGEGTADVELVGLDSPQVGIDDISATGTLTTTSVDLDYTITFDPLGSAQGTFTLTRQ